MPRTPLSPIARRRPPKIHAELFERLCVDQFVAIAVAGDLMREIAPFFAGADDQDIARQQLAGTVLPQTHAEQVLPGKGRALGECWTGAG